MDLTVLQGSILVIYSECWQYMSLFDTAHFCEHSQHFGSCTSSLYCLQLRLFRGSILRVLITALAVIREDTAGIGNILGVCTTEQYLYKMWA